MQLPVSPAVDGKWQAWSLWGGCTKTCGGGSQQRQRVCYGPFFGGEQCPGDREEVRPCNEKRCPGKSHVLVLSDSLSVCASSTSFPKKSPSNLSAMARYEDSYPTGRNRRPWSV